MDLEFVPWILEFPAVISGREVRIDFIDDPHYFRIARTGDRVKVAIIWNLVNEASDGKSVWTQRVSEASTSLVDFIRSLIALSNSLEELIRQRTHSVPDEILTKAFAVARKTAKTYGLSMGHDSKE